MSEQEELQKQADARIGVTLKDKWRLDKLLGVGGMASVYAATHHNQKRVAVKVLHRELSLNAEMRARFLREGYLANTVAHSGVVTVDDDNVLEDGSAFLVMELLEGETIEARRTRLGGTLPVGDVLAYAERLLDVLVAAHDKGVVHRDLKPDNLFLTTAGEIKVLDFGIARLQEMSASTGGTRIGSIMGTPTFMAPEQARARWDEVDGRTDLFAVGATMYTLLSGRYVHEAETINEELGLAMTARATSLATITPDLPAPVVAFVDRALAFEKAARWPDARAMRAALGEVRATLRGGDESVASVASVASRPPAASEPSPISPTSSGPAVRSNPLPSSPESELDTRTDEMAISATSIPTSAVTGRRLALVAGVALLLVGGGILALRSGNHAPAVGDSAPATTGEPSKPLAPPQALGESTASAAIIVTPAEPTAPSVDTANATVHARVLGDDATSSRKDPPKPPSTVTPKPPPSVVTAAPKPPPGAATANPFDRRH
jgi:serine/threonine-protein kinase